MGVSIEKGFWRVDADGIWAAMPSTRERPLLEVDLDVIYGHVSGGVKVYKDLYVTAGVRRVALNYDIPIEDRPQHFERTPGIWDPLVGVAMHSALGSMWAARHRGRWGIWRRRGRRSVGQRPHRLQDSDHFGLTFGYNALYLKLSDTVSCERSK